jgi:hypothetical protein
MARRRSTPAGRCAQLAGLVLLVASGLAVYLVSLQALGVARLREVIKTIVGIQ